MFEASQADDLRPLEGQVQSAQRCICAHVAPLESQPRILPSADYSSSVIWSARECK